MNSHPAAELLHAPADYPPCTDLKSSTTAIAHAFLEQSCQFRLQFPAGGPYIFLHVGDRRGLWNRDHVFLANAPIQCNLSSTLRGGFSNFSKNSLEIHCPDICEARCKRAVCYNGDPVFLAVLQQSSFNGSLHQA